MHKKRVGFLWIANKFYFRKMGLSRHGGLARQHSRDDRQTVHISVFRLKIPLMIGNGKKTIACIAIVNGGSLRCGKSVRKGSVAV